MTNATKTLTIVFAGTLALAFATSWSWSGSSSAAFQNRLLAVDTSAVQTVRIERPDAPSVRLERTTDGWTVGPNDSEEAYPADRQALDQFFGALPSLQVDAVVTRQTDKHPRYGVDSTGTRITMFGSGEEPLGSLIVGRTRIRRPQGQAQNRMQRMRRRRRGTPITYVRTPDRPDVYSIEQSLQSYTGRSVDDWRDKQIWALSRSDIQRIDFTFPGDTSFTMQRVAPSDTAARGAQDPWISEGDTLASGEVSSLLQTISSPQATAFANDLSPDNFGTPRYVIRLSLVDGGQRTLRLRPAASGNDYLAAANDYPYVARLQKSRWDRTVLQGRSALLQSN